MSKIMLIVLILAIGFSCTKAQLISSDIAVKNSRDVDKIPSMDTAHSTSTQNSTSRNHEDIAKENSTETINSTTPQLERTNETSTTKFGEKGVSEDRGSTVLSNSSTTTDSNLNPTNVDSNITNIHHKDVGNVSTTEEVDGPRKTSSAKPNATSAIQPKDVDATTPSSIDIRAPSFPCLIILILSFGFRIIGFIILFALRIMRKLNHAEKETVY